MSSENKFSKMPAYLKVVDKSPADYTFYRIGGLSNGLPSPVTGSQKPALEIYCKFGVVKYKIRSQNGPVGPDMPMRESPNLVYQLTILKCLYKTITQTLAQLLCGYRCIICTCAAPMCCHGVCM